VRDRIMQITIRGHHLAITPAIEENIKSKFNQLTKYLDQVNSMQINCRGLSYLLRQPLMICILQLKN